MEDSQKAAPKLKESYGKFTAEVEALRQKYGQEIEAILKEIEEKKLNMVREKLKNI